MDEQLRPLGSRYRLVSEVGRGAMGEVWKGLDQDGGPVAVKLLLPHLAKDPKMVQRFVAERSVITGIHDPNLVDVRDMVVEGDTLGIVMEFVDGPDLRSYLKSVGTLAPEQVVMVGEAVGKGLQALHAHQVVHRDIKPENVLLDTASVAETGSPTPKITDFGISRLSDELGSQQHTMVVGTPHYMAPEMIDGATPSVRSDLYALGIMLYELVCGVTPFQGKQTMAVLRAQTEREPGRPGGIPDALWNVIDRCLRKDPAQRPASAAEVVQLLGDTHAQVAGLPRLAALTEPPVGALVARDATTFVAPVATGSDTVLAMPGMPGYSGVPGQSVPPGQGFVTGNPYGTGVPHATGLPYGTNPGMSQPQGMVGQGSYGYVPQQQKKKHGGLIAAVAGLLVLAMAGVAFLLLRNRGGETAVAGAGSATAQPACQTPTSGATTTAAAAQTTPAAKPTTTTTTTVTVPPTTAAQATTTTTATQSTTDPTAAANASALKDLQVQATADEAEIPGMINSGTWVLQLSSKSPPQYDKYQLAANGTHTFQRSDILIQYQQLKAQMAAHGFPTYLWRSSRFGKQSSTVYWTVVTVDPAVVDKSSGLTECGNLFPGDTGGKLTDECYPRQVTAAHS